MIKEAESPYPPSLTGTYVRALCTIIEGDSAKLNPSAKRLEEGWVHAEPGDIGVVEYIDEEGYPTVHFFRVGSATVCMPDELQVIDRAQA